MRTKKRPAPRDYTKEAHQLWHSEIQKLIKERGLTYSQAFRVLAEEHKEAAAAYLRITRPGLNE